MKLKQLQALIAIDQGRGMAGAAQALNVSLPAITKAIANLEQDLGVDLVDRSGYRATLNSYGERLAQHARLICAELDEAQRDLRAMQSRTRHLVRINASPAVLPSLLPEAIHRLTLEMPDVTVSFEGHLVGHAPEKLLGLSNGDYDLLINAVDSDSDLSNFHYQVLANMQLKLMVASGHPATRLSNPALTELRNFPWLFPGSNNGVPYQTMRRMFSDSDTPMPEVLLYLPTREMCFSLLHKGTYMAVIPYHAQLYERPRDEFVIIESEQVNHGWPLCLLQRKKSIPNLATQRFIDKLKEVVQTTENG